jgi:hypothetical protein
MAKRRFLNEVRETFQKLRVNHGCVPHDSLLDLQRVHDMVHDLGESSGSASSANWTALDHLAKIHQTEYLAGERPFPP